MLIGIGVSEGIGIGNAVIIDNSELTFNERVPSSVISELERLDNAIKVFIKKTTQLAETLKSNSDLHSSEIITGQIIMISDPHIRSRMNEIIETGDCAEYAVTIACDTFISLFSSAKDDMTRQRAADIRDVKQRMLQILQGIEPISIASLPYGSIIVTDELTPSMAAEINPTNIVGIIGRKGGKTSHSAILARALGIPAVFSKEINFETYKENSYVAINGSSGEIYNNPRNDVLNKLTKLRDEEQQKLRALRSFIGRKTADKEGNTKYLFANMSKCDQIETVIENDAEGVGLFRTEYLFMERAELPSEDEQFDAYKQVALSMNDLPVLIRTIDVGGDKEIEYLGITRESNPFLGFRSVRYCLKNRNVFKTQLKAILRAGVYGDVRIMVPMISQVEEIVEVRRIIKEIEHEFDAKGVVYRKYMQVGAMLETPAACMTTDILSHYCDFFSIGTNDLTQYVMAADRGNANVAYLFSTHDPAVLRMIQHAVSVAHMRNVPISTCGEAASDPLLIPIWLSFGIDALSVSPRTVLSMRSIIAKWTKEEADRVVAKVLQMNSATEVFEYLKSVEK